MNLEESSPSTGPFQAAVSADLAEVLRALGDDGERALNLLRDAAAILDDPGSWHAPYEVAQSCCRGAIDSVLKMTPSDFPGILAARRRLADSAERVSDVWRANADVPAAALDELVEAVAGYRGEEENAGGQRIKQLNHLLDQMTRQQFGPAEVEAARESWTKLHQETSGTLHGSSATVAETHERFHRVVAAFEQLFLGLPERAERIHSLALLEEPTSSDATEVSLMTDPRAGAYFFRTATSGRWLTLLPLARLLPDTARWPALPYFQRQLQRDAVGVLAWVESHLSDIVKLGPGAVGLVVVAIGEAGMSAGPLLIRIVKDLPEPPVLLRVSDWALDIDPSARDAGWVQVVETVLRPFEHRGRDAWPVAQLLRALSETAHPDGEPRPAGDRLPVIIRNAVAGFLAQCLAEGPGMFDADWVNDLTEVSLNDPPHSSSVAAARAVLDIAASDARLGIPLATRVQALKGKVPASPHRERIIAVHLTESHPIDSATPERAEQWWDALIPLVGRVATAQSPTADVFDVIALAGRECPTERSSALDTALRTGLGDAPTRAEITTWRSERDRSNEGLPAPWASVWALASVLPPPFLTEWQPLLDTLLQLTDGTTSGRPEGRMSVWTEHHGGLSLTVFAELVEASGPAAALQELARTPVPRDDDSDGDGYRAGLLSELIGQDPAPWAADAAQVAAVASPSLRFAFFNALRRAAVDGELPDGSHAAIAEAAFAVRPGADASGPDTERFQMLVCALLQKAWKEGLQPEAEAQAEPWLSDLAGRWIEPRTTTPRAFDEAMGAPGGTALLSLTVWGLSRAGSDGAQAELPQSLLALLDRVVDGPVDDQALAVVGYCLPQLVHVAPEWAGDHESVLFALDAPWRPAWTWLRHSRLFDSSLMSRFEREALLGAVREPEGHPVLVKVAQALIDGSGALEPAGPLLAQLAQGSGGPQAVSRLLAEFARGVRALPGSDPWMERAGNVWAAVLDLGLPPEALSGAGRFALAAGFDDLRWLDLTGRTVDQQPVLDSAYQVVKRAAGHPDSPKAWKIAAATLDAETNTYDQRRISDLATKLFEQAADRTAPEWSCLRLALINHGAVELALRETPRAGDTGM
ncbi:hypothetical protein [Streptomyces spororaveus]|uniref:hypothetical protein n=1 Tax=Streptomyces spororaveus TaxID=284039 RepID=UPI00379B39D8